MSDNLENDNRNTSQSTNRKQAKGLSRRRIILIGGAGIVSATAYKASAIEQHAAQHMTDRSNSNGRFQNKVLLITGATSGIGEATARIFAREGAIVHF